MRDLIAFTWKLNLNHACFVYSVYIISLVSWTFYDDLANYNMYTILHHIDLCSIGLCKVNQAHRVNTL